MSSQFRIVMVGPLPPDHSGIAEYAEGLVEMLRDSGMQVDTLTRADMKRVGQKKAVALLSAADAVVYQMGNHPTFHGWMLPLMERVPGIVHLHDLVLHHMVAGVLNDEQRLTGADYPAALAKWHTPLELRSATQALRVGAPLWNRDDVVRYPLHQVATRLAAEVVVHSRYAARHVSEAFPWLPVSVIPQLYPVVAPPRARNRLGTIAVMGGGQANRRFDWLVEALLAVEPTLEHTITVEIAGSLEPEVAEVLKALAGLDNVRLVNHGRVADDEFRAVFERADLMVALREPTMGEASAVVSKAMQAGLPTIVSDQGWYAELPSCVRKIIPDAACPQQLAELLGALSADPAAFERWAAECAEMAATPEFDANVAADRYAGLLRTNRVLSSFRDRVADAVASLKVDIDSPLSTELQRIDVRAGLRGDRWVETALRAMADQDLDSQARIRGATVGPYPYSDPLPHDGYQGEVTIIEGLPDCVVAGSALSVKVQVSNDTERPWFSPMGHAIRPFGIYLGHFWHSDDSDKLPVEQPRTWLEQPVDSSAPGVYELEIRAPDSAGEYNLDVDLVQESVCWFKSRGFRPARLVVKVEAAQP